MLVDISATMNTGNKDHHTQVMSQCPNMVAEYIECGTNTEYEVVQLLTALDLKETHQPVNHGSMTAVIRYRIPYFVNNTSSLSLLFALDNDVELRSILGTHFLLAMGAVFDLVQDQFKCSELNKEFNLKLDPPGKGLSDGIIFDTSFTTVPGGVSSNVTPLFSPLQYTSSDSTITSESQQTYSNNLVLTDNSFQGIVLVTWCITYLLTISLNDILRGGFTCLLLVYSIPLQSQSTSNDEDP